MLSFFRTPYSWKNVLVWLVSVKLSYLVGVFVLIMSLPDSFDQAFALQVRTQWFESTTVGCAGSGINITRYFSTWDAQHYLLLASAGYERDLKSCAFYPLWPFLVRWGATITSQSHILAGMILANMLSLMAWTLFFENVKKRCGQRIALWAVVFIILWPGSLFYQFIYSESLFLFLVMLLWTGLNHDRYELASMAAFLLPIARGVGVFVVLPIAWCLLTSHKGNVLPRWKWLTAGRAECHGDCGRGSRPSLLSGLVLLLSAPLGFATYLLLMWVWTGNLFEGIEAQRLWGVHSISNLWDIPGFLGALYKPTVLHGFVGSFLDRAMFLVLIGALLVIWNLGKDMAIWAYVLGILPAMSGHFTSFTRFAACSFPLFVALAVVVDRQRGWWLKSALLAGFGTLHCLLLWRFLNFRWAG